MKKIIAKFKCLKCNFKWESFQYRQSDGCPQCSYYYIDWQNPKQCLESVSKKEYDFSHYGK